jgi:hypothetical protein
MDSSKGLLRESGTAAVYLNYLRKIENAKGLSVGRRRSLPHLEGNKKAPEAAPPILFITLGGLWSVNPRRRTKRVKQTFCGVSQVP